MQKQEYVDLSNNFALMTCAQYQLEGFILPPTGETVTMYLQIYLFLKTFFYLFIYLAPQFASLQMTETHSFC